MKPRLKFLEDAAILAGITVELGSESQAGTVTPTTAAMEIVEALATTTIEALAATPGIVAIKMLDTAIRIMEHSSITVINPTTVGILIAG